MVSWRTRYNVRTLCKRSVCLRSKLCTNVYCSDVLSLWNHLLFYFIFLYNRAVVQDTSFYIIFFVMANFIQILILIVLILSLFVSYEQLKPNSKQKVSKLVEEVYQRISLVLLYIPSYFSKKIKIKYETIKFMVYIKKWNK